MHDPKFEKDVQQKMEELNLIPSENVWENVEKEIRKEKKRKVPAFWFFLAGGIILAGGGYVLLAKTGDRKHSTVSHSSIPVADATNARSSQEVADRNAAANKTTVQPPIDNRLQPQANNIVADRSEAGDRLRTEVQNTTVQKMTVPETKGYADKKQAWETNAVVSKDRIGRVPAINEQNPRKKISNRKRTKLTDGTGEIVLTGGQARETKTKDQTTETDPANSAGETKASGEKVQNDVTASTVHTTAPTAQKTVPLKTVNQTAALVNKNTDKKNILRKKVNIPHRWKIGLTVGGGLGAVDRSLFKPSSVAQLSSFANTFAAYPPGWQTPGPSTIRPGVSFGAGVFASRSLSRKLSFSIGLDYHYYSTNIHTGPEIKYAASLPSQNLSIMSPATTAARYSQGAYSTGDEGVQKGQYHLLEFPVSLQWQFAKIRKLPVYWENGFAVSGLIGVNALHYDGTSGVYYKDNSLFRKVQTSLSTAILAGIPMKEHSLLVGPQIQYGLSGLLNDGISGEQHLFFGGIKGVFILGK